MTDKSQQERIYFVLHTILLVL